MFRYVFKVSRERKEAVISTTPHQSLQFLTSTPVHHPNQTPLTRDLFGDISFVTNVISRVPPIWINMRDMRMDEADDIPAAEDLKRKTSKRFSLRRRILKSRYTKDLEKAPVTLNNVKRRVPSMDRQSVCPSADEDDNEIYESPAKRPRLFGCFGAPTTKSPVAKPLSSLETMQDPARVPFSTKTINGQKCTFC